MVRVDNSELKKIAQECLGDNKGLPHCCYCGIVYDYDKMRPLMNLKILMGRASDLPEELDYWELTSGACDPCAHEEFKRLDESHRTKRYSNGGIC